MDVLRKQPPVQTWSPSFVEVEQKKAFEASIILKGPPLPCPNVLNRLSTDPMIGERNFYHNLIENVPPLMGLRGCWS